MLNPHYDPPERMPFRDEAVRLHGVGQTELSVDRHGQFAGVGFRK